MNTESNDVSFHILLVLNDAYMSLNTNEMEWEWQLFTTIYTSYYNLA